jgi:hypothetical protein
VIEEDVKQEQLPTISEQMAEQLGGWRGLIESSVPVLVFVVANVAWNLRAALIGSVTTAVGLAVVRLFQRRPIRHAVNGLFGIGIGAAFAWRTGEARDFYLPGILYSYAYALVMFVSIAVRRPLVGWLWSIIADNGSQQWRRDPRLMRTFAWLTALWGVTWIAKVSVQAVLYLAHEDTALGVARIALGYPPYLLLLAITVWIVRRVPRTPVEPPPVAAA